MFCSCVFSNREGNSIFTFYFDQSVLTKVLSTSYVAFERSAQKFKIYRISCITIQPKNTEIGFFILIAHPYSIHLREK